jgi:hypothetical protein
LQLNRQLSRKVPVGSGSEERQFIVDVAVHSKGDGYINVDVQSYFSKSTVKNDMQEDLESILNINKLGEIITVKNSAAVKACLVR